MYGMCDLDSHLPRINVFRESIHSWFDGHRSALGAADLGSPSVSEVDPWRAREGIDVCTYAKIEANSFFTSQPGADERVHHFNVVQNGLPLCIR